MSTTPEERPEQVNESEDLAAQIAALQAQIKELKRRQRQLKRGSSVRVSVPTSVPPGDNPQYHPSHALFQRTEYLLLGLLVLAAFAIRVYRLDSFPDTLLADEAENAQSAIQILQGHPPENGFFGFDWTPQPAFSVYKEAAFISIFGFNILALRLPSALFSTLALIPFYLLLRRQLTMAASLFATTLLATSVWYLNFSRSGWNNIDICLYMLMSMIFLMWAIDATVSLSGSRLRKWAYFAGAGFFCALGLYGYPSGRAITLAVAAFFPVVILLNRRFFKDLIIGYVILFTVELMIFAPEGFYIARHWEHFNGRTKVVLLLNSSDYQANPRDTLLKQGWKNIRAPWDGEVNNTPQYSPVGEPQLERFTGILVLVGMALTIFFFEFRSRAETWLWWLMLLSGWVLTQILTIGTPNGARGVGYMPALLYFAGVSLHKLLQIWGDFFSNQSKLHGTRLAIRSLSITFATGVVLMVAVSNVQHYVSWQKKPHTRQERYLYVTKQEFPFWAETIVELNKKHETMNVGQWRDAHPLADIANPYGVSP